MTSTTRALALASVLAGCSSQRPASPPAASPATAATAPAKSVEPRVVGAWKARAVTDAPVAAAGIVATSSGPLAYVGGLLSGKLELGRLLGSDWKFTPLAQGATMFQGRIAAQGESVVMTAMTLDLEAMTNDVLLVGGATTPVVRGCKMSPGLHTLAIDSQMRPIVVVVCNGRVNVLRQEGATWTTRASWDGRGMLYEAAVDARGRLHVHMISKGHKHVLVDGSAHRDIPLPDGSEIHALGACGGAIHATFRVPGESLLYGTLVDDRWQVETIEKGAGDSYHLGFDEECRPFVAEDDFVWARGKSGWMRSPTVSAGKVDPLDFGSPAIKSLVGHHGTLYAMYEEVRNGVSVGIAVAPEIAEPKTE